MNSRLVALAWLAWLAALALLAPALADTELPARPSRPERFESPEQIAKYLKQLQIYYNVNGRGRYGKRVVPEHTYYPHIDMLNDDDPELPDRSQVDILRKLLLGYK